MRRSLWGRYVPLLSSSCILLRLSSRYLPKNLMLMLSTPCVPLFRLVRSYDAFRLSRLHTLSLMLYHFPPLTPFFSASTMRSVQMLASIHAISSARVGVAATASDGLCTSDISIPHSSISLLSLAPLALPSFTATMTALTPASVSFRRRYPHLLVQPFVIVPSSTTP